jgi:two-component system OmpR family sensor kinase
VEAHCQADIVEMRGDPALLRRMIRNLLENAQRHGGATTIGATLALKPDGTIRLDVCDNGAGVPATEREAIFAPFYRVRGSSESDGGYGLGLSLVRQIAQRHGGDVCYFARPAGGGCFCVTLPGSRGEQDSTERPQCGTITIQGTGPKSSHDTWHA